SVGTAALAVPPRAASSAAAAEYFSSSRRSSPEPPLRSIVIESSSLDGWTDATGGAHEPAPVQSNLPPADRPRHRHGHERSRAGQPSSTASSPVLRSDGRKEYILCQTLHMDLACDGRGWFAGWRILVGISRDF